MVTVEARVDAAIGSIAPGLLAPPSIRRDVVLVTGPMLGGVTSVVSALRSELPKHRFTERLVEGERPIAVVFVASATAPLSPADCRLLDSAAVDTDLVIGVVSKIDIHRTWREVLAVNRGAGTWGAGTWHEDRYARVPWVGVAAAPDLGTPVVADLADLLDTALAAEDLPRRNRLRMWEAWLTERARQLAREGDVDSPGVAELRVQRNEVLRARRLAKSGQAIALRSRIQQARVQMSAMARNHCAAVRAELQRGAEVVTGSSRDSFTGHVHARVAHVVADVNRDSHNYLAGVARELGLAASAIPVAADPSAGMPAELPKMPARSGRLEARLASLVGASLGLGLALTLRRLLSGLTPGWAMAGATGCAVVGVALALWVVRARGLLHQRSVLDRWVNEVAVCLRAAMDERVATWLVAAELAWSFAVAEQDAIDSARVDDEVAAVDRKIREYGVALARSTAIRARELPAITRALAAVRSELAGF